MYLFKNITVQHYIDNNHMSAKEATQIEQGNTNDDVYAFENVVKKFIAEAHKNPAISTAFIYYGAHTPSYDLTLDREKCDSL